MATTPGYRANLIGFMFVILLSGAAFVSTFGVFSSYDETYEGIMVPAELDERVEYMHAQSEAYTPPTTLDVSCKEANEATTMNVAAVTKAEPVACTEHVDVWHWATFWGAAMLAMFAVAGAFVWLIVTDSDTRNNPLVIPIILGVAIASHVFRNWFLDQDMPGELFWRGAAVAAVFWVITAMAMWAVTRLVYGEIKKARLHP
jgi:hypothetical protein